MSNSSTESRPAARAGDGMADHAGPTRAAEPWRSLFPFRSHWIGAEGTRQHFVDEGKGPETVLMVHGNPTWSFFYHALIGDVARWGRAVAVDHVGCGLSDAPEDWNYTLAGRIDDLCQLVERLDLRDVTLVGHDWGGAIGTGCVLRMPERFRRIVLMNTAAFPPPYFPWRIRVLRFPVLGQFAVRGLNLFAAPALRMATARPGGLPAGVAAGLIAPYGNWRKRRAVWEFVRDIPVRTSQPTWQLLESIESGLAGLEMNKLLVWGMRDWCFRPSCLERFLRHWPDAATVRLDRAGHYVLLDEPDAVVSAIRRFVLGAA